MPAHATREPRALRAAFVAVALLAGCAGPAATPDSGTAPGLGPNADRQGHVPEFARMPFEPFTRADAVAIAQREWRLFGQLVDDDPPGTRPPPAPEDKPERMAGLWQRVGEYWWIGQNGERSEGVWTGMHDETGAVFPADHDGYYAWSAAFVSYVMRIAGATSRFPYSPAHYSYINVARQMSLGQTTGWALVAEPPDAYAPQVGDLICTGRGKAERMRFGNLPTRRGFTAHCDIVVATGEALTVIGGNVDDAVTMKHVPTTADGRLATPGGTPVDTRYHWFVVLRVLYDR
jgi:hypothetical protein